MICEFKIKANCQNVDLAIEFIEDKLKDLGYQRKNVLKCLLSCEEIMVQMIKKADDNSFILIKVNNKKKYSVVEISSKGEKCDISTNATIKQVCDLDGDDSEQSLIISRFILKGLSDKLSLKYQNGYNRARIKLNEKDDDSSFLLLLSLIIAVVSALIFKNFIPNNIGNYFETNIVANITSIFLKLITMIVGPMVFFSVCDGVTGFSDIKVFGKIGGKITIHYFFTTIITIFLSIVVFLLISPGNQTILPSVLKMCDSSFEATSTSTSLLNTIINIVPSNIFDSFIKNDMLQIIFIAILFGYAASRIGRYSESALNFIKSGNAIFTYIVTLIVQILPLAIFSMTFSLIYYMDQSEFGELALLYLCSVICFVLMLLVYSAFIVFEGKYSVVKFFSKFKKAMFTAFSTCSSAATMPVTMKCLDDLGISSKIYSFSIPFGATINMDGTANSFVLAVLFMCNVFGIEINLTMLVPLVISIMIFSFGAPCVPGGGVAFYALLFAQAGIPVEAVGFILPVMAVVETINTVVNVTSDSSITLAVARSENLIEDK